MNFMLGFADSVDRIYSTKLSESLSVGGRVRESALWRAVSEMYDYGISGIQIEGFGKDLTIDAGHADAELFFQGLNAWELYLYEDNVELPSRSQRAVRTAVARHVLEGGERYSYFDLEEADYLTLAEIALLADMDERSVRNAANPKIPGALKTETIGKRSLVSITEARRWLAGRKGFIPTVKQIDREPINEVAITLPSETAALLKAKAKEVGMSLAEFIQQHFASEQQ